MKKILLVSIIIALLAVGASGCKNKRQAIDAAHNSQNSLNWDGRYSGTIPQADGEGISVSLTLNLDLTYRLSYAYSGAKDSFIAEGSFTWDDSGSVISLDCEDFPRYYKVGENCLTQLDMNGEVITGEFAEMYILSKEADCDTVAE